MTQPGHYLNDPRYAPAPVYPSVVGHGAVYPMQPPQGWPQQPPGAIPALARYRTALAQKQQLDQALQSAGAEIRTDISARIQALKAILSGESKAFLPEEETARIVLELDHYASVLTPPAPQAVVAEPAPQPVPVAEPLPPQPNGG